MSTSPEDRKRRLHAYVAARLREELGPRPKHGKQADLARRVGISPPHMSNILKAKTGIGDDVRVLLEKYWGLPPGGLEHKALGDVPPPPPPPPSTPFPLPPPPASEDLPAMIEAAVARALAAAGLPPKKSRKVKIARR